MSLKLFHHSLQLNAPIISLAGLYLAVAVCLSWSLGFRLPSVSDYLTAATDLTLFGWAMGAAILVWDLYRHRPKSPFFYLRTWARDRELAGRTVLALPAFAAFVLLSTTFGAVKSAIPLVHPFDIDPVLIRIDAALFRGDAWRFFQPVVGHPLISSTLNFVYHSWFGLLFLVGAFTIVWIEQPRLRLQYLIAYLMSWILLGTAMAALLSSVGPAFYSHFYGDGRFDALTAYLHTAAGHAPIPALTVQEALLSWAAAKDYTLGGGISAMPSMHVAIATLFTLLGWRISTFWGAAASIFLVMIFLGSIHLGYHYAIDGYVSMMLTPIIWWGSGWGAKAHLDRFEARSQTMSAP